MKVIRNKVTLKRMSMSKKDDSFVSASPAERVSFIWELTAEIWSLKGSKDVERRLPRHVANLTRQ